MNPMVYVTVVIFLLILMAVSYGMGRKIYAAYKVNELSYKEKRNRINKVAGTLGFALNERDDYFYSIHDAWQKGMGYCTLYDKMAPALRMLIDCEPVYFEYADKIYLVETWKGQYGIATGAEVGIYEASKREVADAGGVEKTLFYAVDEKTGFYIYFDLYRKGKPFIKRLEKHWWLTAFKVGMCSKSRELQMHVEILFPNQLMSNAYYHALLETGYSKDSLTYYQNVVAYDFDVPKTEQFKIWRIRKWWVSYRNLANAKRYLKYTREYNNETDRLTYLSYRYPILFRMILKTAKNITKLRYGDLA